MDTILDEMQREVEGLAALLRERETGLFTWWKFFNERLASLARLRSNLNAS